VPSPNNLKPPSIEGNHVGPDKQHVFEPPSREANHMSPDKQHVFAWMKYEVLKAHRYTQKKNNG